MKNRTILAVILVLFGLLAACASNPSNWGSFSSGKTESYDQKYYALQTVENNTVVVTVFDQRTDTDVFSFSPARSRDFWGICWENDTYNIWIQSGDVGVLCYRCTNGQWLLDGNAVRPTYIKSKYDD